MIFPVLGRVLAGNMALVALTVGLMLGAAPGKADATRMLTLHLPGGETRRLIEADLAAMPVTEYVTSTVWTESTDRYSGVLLRDLLTIHGIDEATGTGEVHLAAIDGYSAVIAFDMITERAPLLAFQRNGAPMPLRNQGPFWLIFPYDDDPAFRTESIYAKSVWQIEEMSIILP